MNALYRVLCFISFSFVYAINFNRMTAQPNLQTRQIEVINGLPAHNHFLSQSVVGLLVHFSDTDDSKDKRWLQWCTGSVLSKHFILTAAHCVSGVEPEDLQINFSQSTVLTEDQYDNRTQVSDLNSRFIIRQAEIIYTHPKYDGFGQHDLAIIVLKEEIPDSARPVMLLPEKYLRPELNQTSLEKQIWPLLIFGFGIIQESQFVESDQLRFTEVNAEFSQNFVLADQTKGQGACTGDSGGPAFIQILENYYQVGVAHGPHPPSLTCHEQGEWVNPGLDKLFILDISKKMNEFIKWNE